MTGVSECSQQRGNLKDDGYIAAVSPFALQARLIKQERSDNI
ncbi:hypothetical protein [Photorhabdus bodei]|nr:hypothetical protein [Photorhabdus bodei]